MIKYFVEGLRKVEDFSSIVVELENNCEKTVRTVRANGVVLEEFKENNYKSLSL